MKAVHLLLIYYLNLTKSSKICLEKYLQKQNAVIIDTLATLHMFYSAKLIPKSKKLLIMLHSVKK